MNAESSPPHPNVQDASGQAPVLLGQALGLLHQLRARTSDDYTRAAVIDAIIDLETSDTALLPAPHHPARSWQDQLDTITDLLTAAGTDAPASVHAHLVEARRCHQDPQ